MLNRLQTALLVHDFVIQYKKGSIMPADYLSRLPGAKETIASISAFDPFQADLYKLQMQDPDVPEHQPMAPDYTKARPSILHGHDRQAVPRQE
jgi:hypothetical protein